jgi:hypothetical protein
MSLRSKPLNSINQRWYLLASGIGLGAQAGLALSGGGQK